MTNTLRHRFYLIIGVFLFLPILLLPTLNIAAAADFYLSNPGIELRRLQICENCGKKLVVTSIAPGAAVRCPHCQRVQRRLPDDELIIKVYQICPSCSLRLDVSGLKPMEAFKCGSCNFEQRVLPEAVYQPPSNAGVGKIPAEKTIEPTDRLLPPKTREIEEPVIPGLNAPEGSTKDDFNIEIDESEPKTSSSTPSPTRKNTSNSADTDPVAKDTDTSGAYLDLPQMDNDIEGSVSILVNGESIFESEIMRSVLSKLELHQTTSDKPLTAKDKANLYTSLRIEAENELIDEKLILQEAVKEGLLNTSEALPASISNSSTMGSTQQLNLEYYQNELAQKHAKSFTMPSNGDLLIYYNKNILEYSHPDQVVLDSIVIYNDRSNRRDRRSANIISRDIKSKLDRGVDFTLIASRYSEGPFHKEGGRIRRVDGELIPTNFLIKPLRKYQYSLKSGDMFGPLELPTCNLFIQVADVKKGKAKPFDIVKAEVEKAVTQDSMDREFNKWLASIRRAAVIEYTK